MKPLIHCISNDVQPSEAVVSSRTHENHLHPLSFTSTQREQQNGRYVRLEDAGGDAMKYASDRFSPSE